MLVITDAIKWLGKDKRLISLFFEIEGAGILRGPFDRDVLQQLVDCDLVKSDQDGIRLSEQGWKVFEAIEALSLLDTIP